MKHVSKKNENPGTESELGYRTVFNAGSDALFIFEIQTGNIIDANEKASELIGFTRNQLLKKSIDIICIDEEPYTTLYAMRWIQAAVEKTQRLFRWKTQDKNGLTLWVEINMKHIVIDGQDRVLAAIRDITEQMHWEKRLFDYQAQLRSLASQLSRTEERERRRIATVLHDQIGQNLVALKRKMELMRDSDSPLETKELIHEALDLTTQTIKDTSSMTLQLSPPILYELGFTPAVEWLLEQHQKQNHFEYDLEDDGQFKPLSDDIKSMLFQSVRELLINVSKHAKAKKLKASISRRGSFFKISIRDDGVGFEPSKKYPLKDGTGGFGLFNIQERLNYMGGGFYIKSTPGQGSEIEMTVPLALENIINLENSGDDHDL